MQRQASSQQTLAGFDINDFDEAFPENTRSYVAPRYIEPAANLSAQAKRLPLIESHPLQESAVLVLLGLIRAGHSLSVAASWGKDSANCVLLLIEAVRRAVAEGINTLHFITTSNTGTEMPLMEMHAIRCQDEVMKHCEAHSLPIEVHTVYPSLASSFVVRRFDDRLRHAPALSGKWKEEDVQRGLEGLATTTARDGPERPRAW